MKTYLTILGCGSSLGVPRVDGYWGKCNSNNKKNIRTRCSALISQGKINVLIDTSPDLRFQFLKNSIKNITSVLYTHEHADQTHGINDLRAFWIKNKKKINIYSNATTLKHLKKSFKYCFKDSHGYKATLNPNLVKKSFFIGNKKNKINFKTFESEHGKTKSVVYIFNHAAYLSDCGKLTNPEINKLKNLKLLVIDCLRFKPHPSHLVYKDVMNLIKIIRPKKAILTNLHSDIDYNKLSKRLPKNIEAAYDGKKILL